MTEKPITGVVVLTLAKLWKPITHPIARRLSRYRIDRTRRVSVQPSIYRATGR